MPKRETRKVKLDQVDHLVVGVFSVALWFVMRSLWQGPLWMSLGIWWILVNFDVYARWKKRSVT